MECGESMIFYCKIGGQVLQDQRACLDGARWFTRKIVVLHSSMTLGMYSIYRTVVTTRGKRGDMKKLTLSNMRCVRKALAHEQGDMDSSMHIYIHTSFCTV